MSGKRKLDTLGWWAGAHTFRAAMAIGATIMGLAILGGGAIVNALLKLAGLQ